MILLSFLGRLTRFSPTALNDRKFPAKENENLLTPFAILQVNVATWLLENSPVSPEKWCQRVESNH
jgi:hypothetical protein